MKFGGDPQVRQLGVVITVALSYCDRINRNPFSVCSGTGDKKVSIGKKLPDATISDWGIRIHSRTLTAATRPYM
jgi:hypothetical protein